MIPAVRLTRVPPRDPAREVFGPFDGWHAAAAWANDVEFCGIAQAQVVEGTGLELREPFDTCDPEDAAIWEVPC